MGEIDYIIQKAVQHDSRVVRLGKLVFFSSHGGDAWLLDPEDGLALCLARDGVRQQFSVLETSSSFQIAWNAQYRLEGDAFITTTRDGTTRLISGYPVKDIVR